MVDITLADAKEQLRLATDSSAEDNSIQRMIKTALTHVSNYLDRPLTDAQCRDKENPDLLASPLIDAALLILHDLYENRGAQQEATLNINMSCQNLMNPYRKLGL